MARSVDKKDGYKGHRPGSRKGAVHKAFDEKGAEAARKMGEKKGLQESTVRTWISGWQNNDEPERQKKRRRKKT